MSIFIQLKLHHIYEDILNDQFSECTGSQLVTKKRKTAKFGDLVRRIDGALMVECDDHDHDHDHSVGGHGHHTDDGHY
jgi:hypothetical protein